MEVSISDEDSEGDGDMGEQKRLKGPGRDIGGEGNKGETR